MSEDEIRIYVNIIKLNSASIELNAENSMLMKSLKIVIVNTHLGIDPQKNLSDEKSNTNCSLDEKCSYKHTLQTDKISNITINIGSGDNRALKQSSFTYVTTNTWAHS